MADLFRLVYRSKLNVKYSPGLVAEIIHKAQEKNIERKLTGILIYSEDYFFQVLEGELDEINQLYHTLGRDTRHQSITLLHFGKTPKRVFEKWAMYLMDLNLTPANIRELLVCKYDLLDEFVPFPSEPELLASFIHDLHYLCETLYRE